MTKHQTEAELQAFLAEGRTWATDRLDQVDRSRRVAWIIAAVAVTIAALEAIALAGLLPLKTVVPYTVLVDRQTGYVTTLDPTTPVTMAPSEALSKSMLAQYVIARESFDRSSISADYRKVALWSGQSARASYLALMKPGNPAHPSLGVPRGGSLQTTIRSVSLLEAGSALVRYDLRRLASDGGVTTGQPYVSVVRFQFRDRPLAEADRFLNPLGFEVLRYRRDAEAPLPASSAFVSTAPGYVPEGTGDLAPTGLAR